MQITCVFISQVPMAWKHGLSASIIKQKRNLSLKYTVFYFFIERIRLIWTDSTLAELLYQVELTWSLVQCLFWLEWLQNNEQMSPGRKLMRAAKSLVYRCENWDEDRGRLKSKKRCNKYEQSGEVMYTAYVVIALVPFYPRKRKRKFSERLLVLFLGSRTGSCQRQIVEAIMVAGYSCLSATCCIV